MTIIADICHPPADWSGALSVDEVEAMNDAQRQLYEAFGWSLLASLTNYQIGTCPVVVRPCTRRHLEDLGRPTAIVGAGYSGRLPVGRIGMFNPYITGGRWVNGCGCSSSCGCEVLNAVVLPGRVGRVTSVRVDGIELAPADYHIVNGNLLVRADGEPWPATQDLNLPDDQGFTVTYYAGVAPNVMIAYAAGLLAFEFYQNAQGGACRLPGRVTNVTRQSESYELEPQDFPEGKTGIPEVDAVIRLYNPAGLHSPVVVATPDMYEPAVKTWRRRP